jgi:hypothetical protein
VTAELSSASQHLVSSDLTELNGAMTSKPIGLCVERFAR